MKKITLVISLCMILLQVSFAQTATDAPQERTSRRASFNPNWVFSYYPLSPTTGNFKVGLERIIDNQFSLKANVRFGFGDESRTYYYDRNNTLYSSYYNNSYYASSYAPNNYTNNGFDGNIYNWSSGMLELQLRYYLSDKAPKGIYAGGYASYKRMVFDRKHTVYTYDPNSYYYTYTSSFVSNFEVYASEVGLLTGFQLISPRKPSIDIYMGTGMVVGSPTAKNLSGPTNVVDRYKTGINFLFGMNVGLAFKK